MDNSTEDIFAVAQKRIEKLMIQLNNSEQNVILGVVGPNGAGASRSQGEDLWTVTFTLYAWRRKGCSMKKQEITIRKRVVDAEKDELRSCVKPYGIVELKTRISEENVSGTSQGLLIEIIDGNAQDEELEKYADELQKPVVFVDEFFGEFTLDRAVNWFEAEVDWRSKSIRLSLSMDNCANRDGLVDMAKSLWKSQNLWSRRITDFAITELLPLKNESWLETGKKELTPRDFARKMKLESITLYPDGSFEFWHNDGDLFWGHSILVSGDLEKGPTDADIPG